MSEWDDVAGQLTVLAQQILEDIVEDKLGIEAIATHDEFKGHIASVDDFAAGAYGAAESIIETLDKFHAGQCDKEALINEADECYELLDDFEAVRWSNNEAKQRYIKFRRAVGDLSDILQYGTPRRRNFYVYVHKSEDGKVFYVGKGTGKRAWSKERDSVWHRYVKERLGGRYNVEIVRNELDEDEALQIEDEIMLMHGDRLLNFYKPGEVVTIENPVHQVGDFTIQSKMTLMRGRTSEADQEMRERYWKLRDSNKVFVADTKPFESTDLQMAVTRYRETLLRMREYEQIGRCLSRSPGLRGEYEENVQQSTGDVAILDRLTLCLAKLNKIVEVVTEAEQHFAEFPADRETSIGKGIVRRIERIRTNSQKNK